MRRRKQEGAYVVTGPAGEKRALSVSHGLSVAQDLGVALYRVSEGGGVTDVFNVGHVPKRELRNLMFAYIEGLDAGITTAHAAAETVNA